MNLTRHTDYALRVLIYLALRPNERVKLREVSAAYGISHNHLVKVVQGLVQHGHVQTISGREGGMWLANDPATVNLGDVVEQMEPHFALVECLGSSGTCPIIPVCALLGVMEEARQRFLDFLRGYHLSDVLSNRKSLSALLSIPDQETKPPPTG